MEFNPSKATKATLSDLKKPEGLPQIHDNYERPQLEKYEKPEFDMSKKEKPVAAIITPEIKTPEESPETNNNNKSPIIQTQSELNNNVNKVRFSINLKECKYPWP